MRKKLHLAVMLLVGVVAASVIAGCKQAKLSVADEQFERGEYYNAAQTYRKVYNKLNRRDDRALRGRVAWQLATCYRRLNQPERSAASYQNAIRYQYPDSTVYYLLGRQQQAAGRYQLAIEAYNTYLEWHPGDALAKEGIEGCNMALAARNKPRTRYVVRQAKLFNSRRSDFAPMYLDKNLDQLFFTTTNEKVTGTLRSEITGMKKGDIWVAKKDEQGRWKRPEPVGGELNTEMDEGIVSFSPDGQTMYLTRAIRSETANTTVEIYTSRRSDASWSAPQKFEVTADTISAVGHPAISPDGKYLYFASDMPGGYGGKDIWRIGIDERRGTLENMGPEINTAGDEMFPYMRTDSVIYFASDGHPGFGGLDIFRAWLNSTGDRWSVQNMGLPMNSAGDDFGITFGAGESGFFSSNRNDGSGRDHIYSFELPDLRITISGCVTDRDDEPVPNAVIRIVGDDGSNQKEVARDDGSFRFNLQRGVKYVVKAGAKGYLNQKQEFETDTTEADADYAVDFVLASINKPQVVENIFYDFDRATLRPESTAALDEMVAMLRDNPNVSIEMGSHTDRHGSEAYNEGLSDRRAKSVIDYLTAAGIPMSRLSWKGYGKSVPKTVTKRINSQYPQFPEGTVLTEEFILTLSDEDREAADQINRRTEFKVTAIDLDLW